MVDASCVYPNGTHNKRLMVTFPLVTSPKFSLRENFIKLNIKQLKGGKNGN